MFIMLHTLMNTVVSLLMMRFVALRIFLLHRLHLIVLLPLFWSLYKEMVVFCQQVMTFFINYVR
ncbi:hypothetical protein VI06_14515 [Aquitalea magnusonii]|nr:hypothetical protein VI06_14515 [Aquitalea magnusonii]